MMRPAPTHTRHRLSSRLSSRFLALLGLTVLSLGFGTPAFAQNEPQIRVTLEPPTTAPASTVRYRIQVTTEGNHNTRILREPSVPNMHVVGRATDTQIAISGGVAQRTYSITYSIRVPDSPGTYTIGPPLLQVGSQRISAEAVEVRVVPADQVPRTATAPSRSNDVYVAVTHQPERPPYVGEQVLVSYDLMVDTRQARVRPRPPSDPPLDAFWVEELSQHVIGRRQYVQLEGRTWEKTPLRILALFPLRPGPAVIDSMVVPTARGGVFGWTDDDDVASEEIVLEVQPLPAGAPEHFGDGNVGQWSFNVRPETRVARVGEPITIVATASGNGRAGRVKMPPVPPTDDFRFISTSEDIEQNVQGAQVVGRKVERHTIMATREGLLTIPAMAFAYFDPNAGEYRTIESQPITIRAEAGDLPPEPQPEDEPPVVTRTSNQDVDVSASLISGLHPLMRLESPESPGPRAPSITLVAFLAAVPLLGLLLLATGAPLRRRFDRSRAPTKARKKALDAVKAFLEEARTAPVREGYELILRAIRCVMVELLDVPPGSVTETELPAALTARGIANDQATAIARLVKTCTQARFAPSPGTYVPAALIDETRALLEEIIATAAPKPGLTSSNTSASPTLILWSVLFCALFLPTASPAHSFDYAAIQDKAFDYAEAEDWPQAVLLFEQLLTHYPDSALLAHNAGTAHLQAGNLPMGRFYLEQAALLAPANGAIAMNLAIARDLVELSSIAPGRQTVSPRENDLALWRFAASLAPSTLHWALVITLWLALAMAFASSRTARLPLRRSLQALTLTSLILAAAFFAADRVRSALLSTHDVALITTHTPELRHGPSSHAGIILDAVHPGMMLRIGDTRGPWIEIILDEGRKGWILAEGVRTIR